MKLTKSRALAALTILAFIPQTAAWAGTAVVSSASGSSFTTITTPDVAWSDDLGGSATAEEPAAVAPEPSPSSGTTTEQGSEPTPAASRPTERATVQTAQAQVTSGSASTVNVDNLDQTRVAIIQSAAAQLGIPYTWGGTNPSTGFDCSGLVQYAYAAAGVSLPRIASAQGNSGVVTSNPQPGDLVYWADYHIAIYAGNGMMYEAAKPGTFVRYVPVWGNPVYVRVLG